MIRFILPLLASLVFCAASAQGVSTVQSVEVVQWKAVFGRIEARDRLLARSRLGGTVVSVEVVEGTRVERGQQIARVRDEKLTLQLRALEATLSSLRSQLETAETELRRGQSLLERGVSTAQQLDQLRTDVAVIEGRIGTTEAERDVLRQRESEGAVLAPITGTVLDVPLAPGSVVLPGEAIAEIGGGGFFLRLAIPERHAGSLKEGAEIRIGGEGSYTTGTLAKVYPLIENGRVIADVEVEDIDTDFINARLLVRLPVGETEALVVPASAITHRMGLDFVTVADAEGRPVARTVVVGAAREIDGVDMVEILSGLSGGETLVADHE